LAQLLGGAPPKREPSPTEVAAARRGAATAAVAAEDPLAPALRFAGTFEDSIEARRGGGAGSAGDTADRLWDSAAGTGGVGAEARRALLLFTELGGSVVIADDGSVGSGASAARVALRANDIVLPIVGGDAPEWDALALAALCAAKHAHGAVQPVAPSWAELGALRDAAGDATVFPLQLGSRGAAISAAGALPAEAFTWQPARFGATRRVVYVCFSATILAEALKRLVGESEENPDDAGDDVALAARCKRCAFVVQRELAPAKEKAATGAPRPAPGGAPARAAAKASAGSAARRSRARAARVAALAALLVPVVARTNGACGAILRDARVVAAGAEWGDEISATLRCRGSLIRIVTAGGAVASFGRSELRMLKAYKYSPLLARGGSAGAAEALRNRRRTTVFAGGTPRSGLSGTTLELPLVGGDAGATVRLAVLSVDALPHAAGAAGADKKARDDLCDDEADAALEAPSADPGCDCAKGWLVLVGIAIAPVPFAVAGHWFAAGGSEATLALVRAHIAELRWILALAALVQITFALLACRRCVGACCDDGPRGCEKRCERDCKGCKRSSRTGACSACKAAPSAAEAAAAAAAAAGSAISGDVVTLELRFELTLTQSAGASSLAAQRARTASYESCGDDDDEDPIDALVAIASCGVEGWSCSSRLAETTWLGSADKNEENVARNVLERLWEEKATAEDSPPLGWELLDAVLLTQVRCYSFGSSPNLCFCFLSSFVAHIFFCFLHSFVCSSRSTFAACGRTTCTCGRRTATSPFARVSSCGARGASASSRASSPRAFRTARCCGGAARATTLCTTRFPPRYTGRARTGTWCTANAPRSLISTRFSASTLRRRFSCECKCLRRCQS
jgi:hypothetical protein